MRRSFVGRRPLREIGVPTGLHERREGVEPLAQGVDVALLARHDVAQHRVCMVQKCHLSLELLERLGLMVGS